MLNPLLEIGDNDHHLLLSVTYSLFFVTESFFKFSPDLSLYNVLNPFIALLN